MPRVPMRESANVTLNGSGNGTAKIGPLSAREKWYPASVSVHANANATNEATCTVYCGSDTSAPNFRDACVDGSAGDATDKCNGDVVRIGMYIWAVWTGGDAGQLATLTVTGEKDV